MITVESNHEEMPAVPEDLHDMLEEGVELLHGRAVTAVHGNGKVEALASCIPPDSQAPSMPRRSTLIAKRRLNISSSTT